MKRIALIALMLMLSLSFTPAIAVGNVVSDNFTDNVTEWDSVSDIRAYVKSTGIPDRKYIPTDYDCDDFARDLSEQARIDGKEIGLYVKLVYRDNRVTQFHMMNFAIKGNYIYQIEPQSGNVWLMDGITAKVD